jgi:hypothetical protein
MTQTLHPFQAFAFVVLAYGKARDFLTFRHWKFEDSGLWFLAHSFGVTFILVGAILGLFHLTALLGGQWSSADHVASAAAILFYSLPGTVAVFVVRRIMLNRSRP